RPPGERAGVRDRRRLCRRRRAPHPVVGARAGKAVMGDDSSWSSAMPLAVDVYQLTTLIAHAAEGRLGPDRDEQRPKVGMSFFFRRLPKQRNYVVSAGLRAIVEHCQSLRFSASELQTIDTHPVLGPALHTAAGQEVRAALAAIDGFVGDIDALPEGTLAFAGPALSTDGRPIELGPERVPLYAYTPLLRVR